MHILDLKGRIPNEILESLLSRNISALTPPQELAVDKGLLNGKNMVIASPTASGKTLVAELACVNSIIRDRKKAVYIAPMRALASEKYSDFKASYPYIKSALSIGEMDSGDSWLAECSMVFVSTEKFDSLLRHGIDWLQSIGCFVFDEIHMLDDSSRGPTLELLIAKIRNMTDAQIVALSATIGNADEIAEWLAAELVESDFRPVKLRKGVILNGEAYYGRKGKRGVFKKKDVLWEKEQLSGSGTIPETMVVEDTLIRKKQLLVFYSSRRNAEKGASRIADKTSERLTDDERKELGKLSDGVLNVLGNPTEQCKKLSSLLKSGVAFHHAGLVNRQRSMIEEAFKGNLIKCICSTPTLALGVNLPAHTVLVKDVYRYDGGGSSLLRVNEVMQLFGRAGRPNYDTEGRALLIASGEEQLERYYSNYIEGELEPIDSSIGIAPVLRTHILAFIAENFLNTEDSINEFLATTFYGHQYRNMSGIKANVSMILKELREWKFVDGRGGALTATRVGRRVSQLYIDPLSAKWIIESLQRKRDLLGNLFMIANTLEMRPYVKATEDALSKYVAYRSMLSDDALSRDYGSLDYGIYEPERAFATALMLNEWIDETKENVVVERYSTTPGALYTKLTNADWLLYSSIELAKLMHVSAHDLLNLNVRIKYGIREELLDLVRLEQIGRVRARLMFMNGIRTVSDIRENRDAVKKLLGKEIAEKVFKQLD